MNGRTEIAAVVLAAGLSRRMGSQDKLLTNIGSRTILQWTVKHVLESCFEEVYVVAGAKVDAYTELLKADDVTVLHNRDYEEGMASSIRAGVAALGRHVSGAMILLADQPLLAPATINRFLQTFLSKKVRIVAASSGGRISGPAIFCKSLFSDLLQLRGDIGARQLFSKYQNEIQVVELCPEEALDIDAPEDIRLVRQRLQEA